MPDSADFIITETPSTVAPIRKLTELPFKELHSALFGNSPETPVERIIQLQLRSVRQHDRLAMHDKDIWYRETFAGNAVTNIQVALKHYFNETADTGFCRNEMLAQRLLEQRGIAPTAADYATRQVEVLSEIAQAINLYAQQRVDNARTAAPSRGR